MNQGLIYCLSNPFYPDVYKIGFTRKALKKRLQSLYTTGVVYPFKVKFAKNVNDCIDCKYVFIKNIIKVSSQYKQRIL